MAMGGQAIVEPITEARVEKVSGNGREGLPELPTFSLDVGWKYVENKETGQFEQVPLTLLDVLYPSEEVQMPESGPHSHWLRTLYMMLHTYLAPRDWLVLSDVEILWGPGIRKSTPDISIFPGAIPPHEFPTSYRVEPGKPVPAFVIELTSTSTHQIDLNSKPLDYAAVGVREYLIVDMGRTGRGPWRLLGYRLGKSPFYEQIKPDDEGGLRFESIGLRFLAVGRERVEVYEIASGQRLLFIHELEALARQEAAAREQAEAQVEAEVEARQQAEARLREMEARVRELEARLGESERGHG
jgi:Uma2 family endonuclease